MPAEHDLDPPAMTEAERRAKRRYEAGFAFETMPANLSPGQFQHEEDDG
jgi:hypothetical protein